MISQSFINQAIAFGFFSMFCVGVVASLRFLALGMWRIFKCR